MYGDDMDEEDEEEDEEDGFDEFDNEQDESDEEYEDGEDDYEGENDEVGGHHGYNPQADSDVNDMPSPKTDSDVNGRSHSKADSDVNDKELEFDITVATSRGFTVTKLLPDNRRCLQVLEHVNTIALRVDTEWIYILEGLTSTGTVAKVSGMLYEHMIPDQCERLHVLDDLVTVFFGAPVVEIRIEQHDSLQIEK